MTNEQLELDLVLIRVHCFACPHTVEAADPETAHGFMEHHYSREHEALIDQLVAGL